MDKLVGREGPDGQVVALNNVANRFRVAEPSVFETGKDDSTANGVVYSLSVSRRGRHSQEVMPTQALFSCFLGYRVKAECVSKLCAKVVVLRWLGRGKVKG